MTRNLSTIVLAAGKGKRMLNPELPKVLTKLQNKALIDYVLELIQELNPEKSVIVVGFQKDQVIEHIKSLNFPNIEFAEQKEQLGTGHAVMSAYDNLAEFDGDVLILAGDVPMMRNSTIRKFINLHTQAASKVSVLSTDAPNPTGYGRIIRDSADSFIKIVEEKDADTEQKLVKEINSGIFLVDSKLLFDALQKIGNKNAQNEYYLTDIIQILRDEGESVHAINCSDFAELQGINTAEDLLRAEQILQHLKQTMENDNV
ncbi:MAG: NTP transferase domain-containing protein [Desulfobulbaceae bacterium]|nr:NTP transferase domain-containing protein [Candidatus Kapabacteria bacterium]MBS3999088.1 NTP transferase domain-containing protein [Desulfobulbaceae bacterium]